MANFDTTDEDEGVPRLLLEFNEVNEKLTVLETEVRDLRAASAEKDERIAALEEEVADLRRSKGKFPDLVRSHLAKEEACLSAGAPNYMAAVRALRSSREALEKVLGESE